MDVLARFLAVLFLRRSVRGYVQRRYENSFTNELETLNMRLPQIESGIYTLDDSFVLSSLIQNRLEELQRNNPKKPNPRIARLLPKLENIKQNILPKLDADSRNRLQAKSQALSFLPDLQLLSEMRDRAEVEKELSRGRLIRGFGIFIILAAILSFCGFFAVFASFDETVSEDLSGNVALATFCVPLALLIPGIIVFMRGNLRASNLAAEQDIQNQLDKKRDFLNDIYGSDASRYTQLYTETSRELGALLQRTKNQDLRRLFQ